MQQTVSDVEIIVVDSGATDATLRILSKYPVKILSISPDDFSLGRSLNMGCNKATGEFIVIASVHVYPVYNDLFERMLVPFCEPQAALVYGKQMGDITTKYSEKRIFTKWFPGETNTNQIHPHLLQANL